MAVFRLQNYNEFKVKTRWHDYLSIMINEFAVLNVRKYWFLDEEVTVLSVQILGFTVYHKEGTIG
jgi:hypothetical protein